MQDQIQTGEIQLYRERGSNDVKTLNPQDTPVINLL